VGALATILVLPIVAAAAGADPSAPIHTLRARQQETGFGDAIADAIRAAARADIAWVAGGEFREPTLNPGAATAGDIASLLDNADDSLVVVSLSGATIREALEWGLQQYPKPGKAFLHVSGVRVAFRAQPREGRRVLTISLPSAPLAADRSYRVAMTRTLA